MCFDGFAAWPNAAAQGGFCTPPASGASLVMPGTLFPGQDKERYDAGVSGVAVPRIDSSGLGILTAEPTSDLVLRIKGNRQRRLRELQSLHHVIGIAPKPVDKSTIGKVIADESTIKAAIADLHTQIATTDFSRVSGSALKKFISDFTELLQMIKKCELLAKDVLEGLKTLVLGSQDPLFEFQGLREKVLVDRSKKLSTMSESAISESASFEFEDHFFKNRQQRGESDINMFFFNALKADILDTGHLRERDPEGPAVKDCVKFARLLRELMVERFNLEIPGMSDLKI